VIRYVLPVLWIWSSSHMVGLLAHYVYSFVVKVWHNSVNFNQILLNDNHQQALVMVHAPRVQYSIYRRLVMTVEWHKVDRWHSAGLTQYFLCCFTHFVSAYFTALLGLKSVVISLSVCASVCLFARIT